MPRLKTNLDDMTRKILEESLREIIPLVSVDDSGGISLQGLNIFNFETQLFDLTGLLDKALPAMPQSVAAEMTRQAVYKLAKKEPQAQSLDALFDELGPLLEDDRNQIVSVIQFLNVDPAHSAELFTTGSTVLTRLPAEEAMPPELSQNAERLNPGAFNRLNSFTAYQYEVKVPGYIARHHLAHNAGEFYVPFERMRALLSFAHQYGRITMRHSVETEPLGTYLPSPFILVGIPDEPQPRLFYSTVRVNYRRQSPEQSVWDKAADLSRRIYGNPELHESMVDFIDLLLKLYQQALDATAPAIAFLHFWQVLERLASPTQRGRGIETKALLGRLNIITPLSGSQRRVLMQLGEVRHGYVHGGEFPYGQGDQVNRLLKSYADENLARLINTLDVFQSIEDLEQYYVVAIDPKELRLTALEKAIAFQTKKSGVNRQTLDSGG